jgi:hypothetical protein
MNSAITGLNLQLHRLTSQMLTPAIATAKMIPKAIPPDIFPPFAIGNSSRMILIYYIPICLIVNTFFY